MANVKNGAFREIIIDRCLQSRRGYSTQEILGKCNDALERRGEMPVTASNTIRNDILSIENRFNIIVEPIRSGRIIRYRYKDPHFSIFNSPLNDEDILQLTQSVSVLRRFEGMPGFEWVEEMSAHLQTTVISNSEPIIGFDDNKELKGMEFFTPLFKAISGKRTIKLSYHSFKSDKVREVVIHPYYLKEYNQRWFLFARNDEFKYNKNDRIINISTYALDRIESIEMSSAEYIPNTAIDFSHYFDKVIGVSFKPNDKTQTIKIWVDKEQLPYTLSKPLHRSQTMIEKNVDGSALIAIEVIPNFELEQLLLSFGERIEILSPVALRNKLSSRIEKNIENYK